MVLDISVFPSSDCLLLHETNTNTCKSTMKQTLIEVNTNIKESNETLKELKIIIKRLGRIITAVNVVNIITLLVLVFLFLK